MCFAGAAASKPAPKAAAARPAAAEAPQKVLSKHAHPLADLGGHQMPTSGKIGGQKRVGAVEAANEASVKRKREDSSKCCFIDAHRYCNPQPPFRQCFTQPALPSYGQSLHAFVHQPAMQAMHQEMSTMCRHGREGKGGQKYDCRGSQGSGSQRGSQATGAGTNRSGLRARLVTGGGCLRIVRLLVMSP